MIKDLKYSGYSAQPSDHDCPDGALASSINLINEDAALKPILPPRLIKTNIISSGAAGIYIHKTALGDNYIEIHRQPDDFTPRALWIGQDGEFFDNYRRVTDFEYLEISKIISIASIGNILIFSTDNGLFYSRFQPATSTYSFLRDLPDIKLNFGLKLNFTTQLYEGLSFEIIQATGSRADSTEWSTLATSSYRAAPNDGSSVPVNDLLLESGKFSFGDITLHQSVEYKFTWRISANPGRVSLTTIVLFGKKAGDSTHTQLTGAAGRPSSEIAEMLFTPSADYTDIYYTIKYQNNSAYPDLQQYASGNTALYQGVTHQPDSGTSTEIRYTSEAYNAIMGVFNKFTADKAHGKARFIYPFFLRYAIRMFDGSYARISDPICLVPNSGYVPAAGFSSSYASGTHLQLSAFLASIRYRLASEIPEVWTDVITGVDIFISKPIWAYSQGENFDAATSKFRFRSSSLSKGVGVHYVGGSRLDNDGLQSYHVHSLQIDIDKYAQSSYTTNFVEIAPRTSEDIADDVASISTFYKVASLTTAELNNTTETDDLQDLQLNIEKLDALYACEPLDADILPYKGFADAKLSTYNSRLNISGSSAILPEPSVPSLISSYIGGVWKMTACVYIKTSEGTRIVISESQKSSYSTPWFFYPDSNAYKAVLLMRDQYGRITAHYELELKPHDMLNGAYWFSGNFLGLDFDSIKSTENPLSDVTPNDRLNKSSVLYVAEANNPFVFRASTNVAVGANNILATATAAKALSQGQFGQFPLYAFTDQGVWAMEVAADGTYSARQPITRDVCITPDGITQIDSAVLFPTDRGIMLLSGSNCTCISDTIRTEIPFNLASLPKALSLHSRLEHGDDETCFSPLPFTDFLKDCRMIYDYVHQRIIVYNSRSDVNYAYVYSLKSQLWGMMYTNVADNLNSYPNALAITSDGNLVDFSRNPTPLTSNPSFLITRPLKLDAPDVFKTVDTVIQRGNFKRGHVQSILYGSRDLYSWHLVWSSKDHYLRGFRGTPYKYFRIALLCNLAPDEAISGASIQFTPKLNNRPR